MSIISFDYGHGIGEDRGAVGLLNEETCIRQYGPVCVNELMRQGHTLVNCTPPPGSVTTLQDSLSYRTNAANASGSILHVCFHVNASGVGGHGEEIEVASDTGAIYAQLVYNEILKLGFTPRAINRPNLWVTAHTNMPAILLEPFFCDSATDVALYNPNTLGLAVATGILNKLGTITKPAAKEVSPVSEFVVPIDNNVVPTGDNIIPIGSNKWIELVEADGRIILHQSRSVYLAYTVDGHLDSTVNGVTVRIS